MQKQQCNKENDLNTHDASHDASFFDDALYIRQQATLNLTTGRSASLVVMQVSLCVVICQTATQQNSNVHPHYMLTQLHPLNIFL